MSVSVSSGTLEKFTTFGDLLRFLRRRAGITQSELAATVGYSDGQISRLEQNLRLADPATIASRFVPALGLEDEPKVIARLLDLAASVRREDAPGPGLCPFKGLGYFDEIDAELFVGREAVTEKLRDRILALASGGVQRFFAVVGASGSGKSSLVRAGLVPALRWNTSSVNWPIHIFTPTAHPLKNLAVVLTADNPTSEAAPALMEDFARDTRGLQRFISSAWKPADASHWLLVVDQFEELFTLCHSEDERASFISNLLTAVSEPEGSVITVITLRADFYAYCANYLQLREALARQQEYIGAMTDEELRRAIEEPARRGRWEFEPGLVDLLLHDVGHEPGALPLLSHALLETWQRRRGRTMTLSGYASSGGVRGAIAETAESVFTDQFTHEQQEIARRIFLRLTELGDETASVDTRRRATFNELILKPEDASTTQTVLRALADARLITTSKDSAEVAHEALIREWPTLRGWLESNREALHIHRHLTEAAREWLGSNRHTELLYRAGRLSQALEWRDAHPDDMNTFEREFLEASQRWVEQEAAEREAQRQHQLEAAQKLAEVEGRRAEEQAQAALRLRKRAFHLATALVTALALGVSALFFGIQARQAARTERSQQRIAFSRELAAAAISNLNVDPERSILLSREAVLETYSVDKTWTVEAEQALRRALLTSRLALTLRGHSDHVMATAFSPDGDRLATAGDDGTLRIWDARTGQEVLTIATNAVRSRHGLAFSPDGKRLASATESGTARIWDAATGRELIALVGHTDWVTSVAFSQDGERLATASEDRTVRVWEAATGKQLLLLRGHLGAVWDVAFSPDGKLIATAGEDGKAILWEAGAGAILSSLADQPDPINAVAFAPDGTRLATGSDDRTARIWDVVTGRELLAMRGHTNAVARTAFSPDGGRLATASTDGTARIWDTRTGQELLELAGHTGQIAGVAFSPECKKQERALAEPCGSRLATASWDGTAKIWDISSDRELLTLTTPDASAGASSPDGKRMAAGYMNGAVRVWDITKPLDQALDGKNTGTEGAQELLTWSGNGRPISGMVFGPGGGLLAAGDEDGDIFVWDLKDGAKLFSLRGHTAAVQALVFSRDGTKLATAGTDSMVKIWDFRSETGPSPLAQSLSMADWSSALAFSLDGSRLATGTNDGMVRVWEIRTGKELLSLQGHSGEIWGTVFSPDGTGLASASNDGTAIMWDAATGQELLVLRGKAGEVNALAFSPDGTQLATANQDGTARLWDRGTGRELLTVSGNSTALLGIAFSEDGRRLVTASDDGAIHFYLLRMEDLLALAGKRVSRTFYQDECRQYLHESEVQCAQNSAPVTPIPGAAVNQPAQQSAEFKGRVCEVTDEAGINDQFYNEIAHKGLEDSARLLGWEAIVLESRHPSDYEKNMANSLKLACDLVVIPNGFQFGELTRAAAQSNPGQKFQIMEAIYDSPPDNVWVQEFAVDQAAFLAGYTAAALSKTAKVGTFGGMNFPSVTIYMDGFARGVAYYNQVHDAQVELFGWDIEKREGTFTGDFVTIEDGYQAAELMINQGVDIILPVAGQVGLGAAAAAKDRGGVFLIGVDTDWAVSYPEFSAEILTSIEKRLDISVLEAIEAVQGRRFTGGTHTGTLGDGGVSIASFHSLDSLVSAEIRQELEHLKADIISGMIKTRGGNGQ